MPWLGHLSAPILSRNNHTCITLEERAVRLLVPPAEQTGNDVSRAKDVLCFRNCPRAQSSRSTAPEHGEPRLAEMQRSGKQIQNI